MEYRDNDKRFKYRTKEEKYQADLDRAKRYRDSHKELCKKRRIDWQIRNPEKFKESQKIKDNSIKGKLRKKRSSRNYRIIHSDRAKATSLLRYSVGKGYIIKPKECSKCYKEWKIIDGHHEDYNKPLEVIWLCRPCHLQLHRDRMRR